MSRKSQQTIGSNVDIPATTEFEEFAFLGIDGKLPLTSVQAEQWEFTEAYAWTASSLISTNSQGG